MTFENLDLIEPILNALKTKGYTEPTPIQEQAIPIILAGRDILGCAQTGTGKTAAFSIPIIQRLVADRAINQGHRKVQALIVTPTRELAIQIGESIEDYGKNCNLKHAVIFGGVSQHSQVNSLKSGVDILVATPGRLLDLVNQGFVRLGDLKVFVLDEADRMLDMGFIHDVKRILRLIPEKRQSLFFSATMPDSIMHLAGSILTDPEKVSVTPISSTAETITQSLYYVDQEEKYELLTHILQDKSIRTALVFTRTKHGADKVVKMLAKKNITAEAIHGNKSQNARQRALSNFKDHSTRVLVATDIAARGIDIDELAFVVNFEVPNIAETYVHRIGRTGRAGAEGKAISFCDVDEWDYVKDIEKLISIKIPVVKDHPYPAQDSTPTGKNKPQPRNQNPNARKTHRGGTKSGDSTSTSSDRNSYGSSNRGSSTSHSSHGTAPKKKFSWDKKNVSSR